MLLERIQRHSDSHLDGESHWLEQFRSAALLSLDEQIRCCDALLEIWLDSGNLDAAESCARISTNLKIQKFGYSSFEVAHSITKSLDIHLMQGDHELAVIKAKQRDAIIGSLRMHLVSREECLEETASENSKDLSLETRYFEDYLSELSLSESLHEAAVVQMVESARESLDKLFAA